MTEHEKNLCLALFETLTVLDAHIPDAGLKSHQQRAVWNAWRVLATMGIVREDVPE
jgi:acyl-CoA-binding protein